MHITRRELLITSSILAASSAAAFMCGRSSGPKTFISNDCFIDMHLDPEHYEILKYASLAPSGHNAQPWEIIINQRHKWEIGIAETRTLPEIDPHNRESKLSVGAYLANLEIAASAVGYSVEYEFIPENDGLRIATIHIQKNNNTVRSEFLSLIKTRYTHRGILKHDDLKSQLIRNISGNSCSVHYIPGSSTQGRNIGIATIEANRAQANRRAAMIELSEWIRWSNLDAEKFPAGITPESMGISGIPLWIVKHFYGPADVLKPGFIEKTVESATESVNNCGGWIIITSGRESNKTLARTGMLFEKIFLKSRAEGLGIHPMTQVLEEEGFTESINSITGITDRIQFLLRTGYVYKFPDYRKLRLPPEYYTKCTKRAI